MPKPASNNTWINQFWNKVPYPIAAEAQKLAKWVRGKGKEGSVVSPYTKDTLNKIEDTWKDDFSPEQKKTIKKVVQVIAGLGVFVAAGVAAVASIEYVESAMPTMSTVMSDTVPLTLIKLTGATAANVVDGIASYIVGPITLVAGATVYRWINKDPEAVKDSHLQGLTATALETTAEAACLYGRTALMGFGTNFLLNATGSTVSGANGLVETVTHPAGAVLIGGAFAVYQWKKNNKSAKDAAIEGIIAAGALQQVGPILSTTSSIVTGAAGLALSATTGTVSLAASGVGAVGTGLATVATGVANAVTHPAGAALIGSAVAAYEKKKNNQSLRDSAIAGVATAAGLYSAAPLLNMGSSLVTTAASLATSKVGATMIGAKVFAHRLDKQDSTGDALKVGAAVALGLSVLPPILGASAELVTGSLAGVSAIAASTGFAVIGGTATGIYQSQVNDASISDSVGTGVIAGASILAGNQILNTANPMLAAVAGAVPGGIAALSTAAATHPGSFTLVQVPNGPLARFDNPSLDDKEQLPPNPSAALDKLAVKVNEFRQAHPPEHLWVNPQDVLIKNLVKHEILSGRNLKIIKETLESLREASSRNLIRTLTANLGRVPTEVEIAKEKNKEKIDTIVALFTRWKTFEIKQDDGSRIISPADITTSFIEKIEELPIPSKIYIAAQKETDKQIELLVENSSQFATLSSIHCLWLGHHQTAEVNTAFRSIIKEFSEADKTNTSLWNIYMSHLGNNLTFFQRSTARIMYFFIYSIGIIPNTFNTFVTNIITEFRKPTKLDDLENLPAVFTKTLTQLKKLLEVYNSAVSNYAEDKDPELRGRALSDWKEKGIGQLGDDDLLERLKKEAGITEKKTRTKMMTELCKELTNNLVNECFPRVEFFEELKKTSVWKIRIGIVFDAFDWVFGGMINFAARELTRFYLPGMTQSLVEIGLNKTLPGQYAFKIALANSIKNQVEALHEEMKKPSMTKPPRLVKEPVIVGIIEGVADSLIRTLKIKKELGESPKKEEAAALLKELKDLSKVTDLDRELRGQLIDGTKLLIYFYTKKPEKIEKLFGDVLRLSNNSFGVNTGNDTEAEYQTAMDGLELSCKNLLKDAVKARVEKEVKGPDPVTLRTFMEGKEDSEGHIVDPGIYPIQRDKGERIFETLSALCQVMQTKIDEADQKDGTVFLTELDHFAETLKEFAIHAKSSIEIDLFPEEIQIPFYQTFHAIYQNSIPLAQKAKEIQVPAVMYDKYVKLAHALQEFTRLTERNMPAIDVLKENVDQLRKIAETYNSKLPFKTEIPGFDKHLKDLNEKIVEIKDALTAAQIEQSYIESLSTLPAPGGFAEAFLNNPKYWSEKLKSAIPREDQSTFSSAIRKLETESNKIPRPDLSSFRINVEQTLQAIFEKHLKNKAEHIKNMNTRYTSFIQILTVTKREAQVARRAEKNKIEKELLSLSAQTNSLLEKIKKTQMPDPYLPSKDLKKHVVKFGYETEGKPIVEEFEPFISAGFDLLSHNDIYQGAARLTMGAINEQYTKKPTGVTSSLFQWFAKKVLPAPVGSDKQ